MDFLTVEDYVLSYPAVIKEESFEANVRASYKIRISNSRSLPKLFALIEEKQGLVHLSLKCDALLCEILREKYESVLPGHHLPQKYWNTIILSGQLNLQQIKDLIDHSYNLTKQQVELDLFPKT